MWEEGGSVGSTAMLLKKHKHLLNKRGGGEKRDRRKEGQPLTEVLLVPWGDTG